MVQTLNRCRSCGLPAKLAERLEWRSGGTITLHRMRSVRLMLIDAQTMDRIHGAVTAGAGETAFLASQVEATRLVTGKLTAGIKGRLTRYGAVKKKALEAMEEYSLLLGMGRIEMEKFTPGEGGSLVLHEPFDISVVAGGILGVLEELDRCGYGADISNVGERAYRLVLEQMESQHITALSVRNPLLHHDGREGEKAEGCPMCGLPQAVSLLRWDEVHGKVAAGAGGRRVAFLPAYILDIAAGLGNAAGGGNRGGVVEGAVYAATRAGLEASADDAFESTAVVPRNGDAQAACDSMRVRGWGEVADHKLEGRDWWIEVINPVHEGLIAGWLRALHDFTTGDETSAVMEMGRNGTAFRLV